MKARAWEPAKSRPIHATAAAPSRKVIGRPRRWSTPAVPAGAAAVAIFQVGLDDWSQLRRSTPMRLTAQMLSGLSGALANGFLILLTVVFIMLEASGLPRKLTLALDNVETGVDRDRAALAASLAVARDQVESLRRLASAFSEHARQPEPAFKIVVLEGLLQAVAQAARAAFTGIDLAVVTQDPPDSVDGDAEQLRRALHNLIKNAVEVAPGAPVVLRCGSGPGDARWWVEVEDRGPGLPASVEERLGDEQVSTRDGGSGLGLAVVTAVATAHGGRVEVMRPGSGGTIIRMALARRAPAPAPGGAA